MENLTAENAEDAEMEKKEMVEPLKTLNIPSVAIGYGGLCAKNARNLFIQNGEAFAAFRVFSGKPTPLTQHPMPNTLCDLQRLI